MEIAGLMGAERIKLHRQTSRSALIQLFSPTLEQKQSASSFPLNTKYSFQIYPLQECLIMSDYYITLNRIEYIQGNGCG